MTPTLTAELAARFAQIALGHVTREYPHKADHVMESDADMYIPRKVHPIFYGSFDWHSCVHGYWLLARVRHLFPDLPEARAIDALFKDALTEEKVATERAYLERPSARSFERPYGWAWLLMLAAELRIAGSPYATMLQPLADAFVRAFHRHLPMLTYPIRAGTHANSAFALVLAERYARVANDTALRALLVERANCWFGQDTAVQPLEPSGEDFLSPALMEALAMRWLLPRKDFSAWFAQYLPTLAGGTPSNLLTPAQVSDRSDGKLAHLDGLNLSRAWAMRALASAIEDGAAKGRLVNAAEAHLKQGMAHITGDYMGEHWLATFALLAVDASA